MQTSDAKADLILSRFPGPVTLYPSRKKWLVLLLNCGLVTVAGYVMVSNGTPEGWFILVFFGLLSILVAIMLLPGAGVLTLDGDGFQATRWFQRHRSRWRNVAGFVPVAQSPYSREQLVVYDDVDERGRIMAELNRSMGGHNAFLPDTYGLSGDELAQLMIRWRERVVAA